MMKEYKQGNCEKQGCSAPAIGELCWQVESLRTVWSTTVCRLHARRLQRILKSDAERAHRTIHVFLMVRP
jgi:hypothetical protein